ncbi:uncharacterized protein LOC132744391 [Ruditapes philippinarum]|uniref:uncharacterized protein LOC132744391 n=1 Tax=Ruditapes philippinarum TaxID=129788 RepID=UPI00295A6B5F|nr:uncharacterized protein LOC132744391 [Ruditapes philippinarum]
MGIIDDITGDKTDTGDDGQGRTVEAETDLDGNPVETRRDGREDRSRWTEDVKEVNDDIVEGMIEEGIRQVTQDGFIDLEEDTVQYPSHMTPNRSYDNEGEDVEIDDVLGPEVDDDDNMSETSVRSTEQPIVIDKSLLHSSPRQVSERTPKELSSPDSPDMFIDEERFPSLENSPREAIIIDRSFQTPSRGEDKLSYSLPMNQQFTSIENQSPGFLSMSLQGKPSPVTKTPVTKDFLSRSLVMERSPLSEEIRKMFKKAIEDTPPPKEVKEEPVYTSDLELPDLTDTGNQGGSQVNSPGYQGNTLKQTDISWDLTENLDDIEIPDLDGDIDDDIDDILTANDNVLQKEGVNLDDDDDMIDDFFTSKTPELPKRRALVDVKRGKRTPPQEKV